MTKDLWINLPVKDIKLAKEFFRTIGFGVSENGPGNTPTMSPVTVGTKKVVVMLIQDSTFKSFCHTELADAQKVTEVILSFDAETQEEVDEMSKKVTAAGGKVTDPPAPLQGWMYNCAFSDLDGHRWNILYMDQSKMPK